MSRSLARRDDESQELEVVESDGVIEQLARGEIASQVETAKRYPRSIKRFLEEAQTMACLDEDTAASCIYALPRGGKSIEGPSARLAEIIASAWGNCRAGARVVSEDARFVTAQGFFFDVQRNFAVTFEVRRRITDKHGQKFNDDMVGVTANAACSIALRNAVFKGVPKAFWGRVYDASRHTAIGDAKTLETKRADMIAYFAKMGVTEARVLATLGCGGVDDIGLDHLALLKGLATALKENETSIEQAFVSVTQSSAKGAVSVDAVLKGKATIDDKKAPIEEPAKTESAAQSKTADDETIDQAMDRWRDLLECARGTFDKAPAERARREAKARLAADDERLAEVLSDYTSTIEKITGKKAVEKAKGAAKQEALPTVEREPGSDDE